VDVRDTEPPTPWHYPLTKREAEVAELIAAGSTNLEIATRFGFSEREIGRKVIVIMSKLALNRAEIAPWVARHRPA
jgi:DNA-binding NarL/FixJ family response regulator